jgi:hypothetical protein
MADIFISYSHGDLDFVRDMVPLLEREGFSVWWDHTIPPGKTWDDVIAKGIKDAKACIIVWSPLSVVSDWVKEEATLAKQGGKYLPVQVGTGEPPIGFRRIQAANLQTWTGNSKDPQWRLLITEAARLVKGEPVEETPGTAMAAGAPTAAPPIPAAAGARPGVTLNRSVLTGVAAVVILLGGLVGGWVWWRASSNPASAGSSVNQTTPPSPANEANQATEAGYSTAPAEPRSAGTVVGTWNGKWHYDTDPPQTSNWMKGTFRADGIVIGETSEGRRVAQYSQSGADVRWAFNDFLYVAKVTGNRLSGTFIGPDRTGVFEATR